MRIFILKNKYGKLLIIIFILEQKLVKILKFMNMIEIKKKGKFTIKNLKDLI